MYCILAFKTSFVEVILGTWCLEGGVGGADLINPSEIIKHKLIPVTSPLLMDTIGDLITFSSF